jgi:S1-C subfamily serine protease
MTTWTFPQSLQPDPRELDFDLGVALESVVMLHAEIPEDAFTASILGTERIGSAVTIRQDGLLLTVGYLITEAETIWLTTNSGDAIPGHALAYDFSTGFGLVQPLGKLNAPVLTRGSAQRARVGDSVIVVGHGGRAHTLKAKVSDKREFAGYWEYVLDEALFTSPAHPQWGGTALLSQDGRLLGIGSLLVEDAAAREPAQGNMIIPIDLLEPILDDLLTYGRSRRPTRPWLGMYVSETDGQQVVAGVAPGGPADRAGVLQGDVVLEVDGERSEGLADLFRRIWHLGPAGTEIPLLIGREEGATPMRIRSADRSDFLKRPRLH